MERVAAALADGVDDAAERRAVFRVVARLLDLDGVDEVLHQDLGAGDGRPVPVRALVRSTPSTMKRFSEPEAPSMLRPPLRDSLFVPESGSGR